MSTSTPRLHCRVRGALSPRAKVVLEEAQRGGDDGVPVEALVSAQTAHDSTASHASCLSMTDSLRRRGLLRYTGAWRCGGGNWVLTPAGQRAIEAAAKGRPLRPTDVLVHAMLQALVNADRQRLPITDLIDVQIALRPDRRRDTSKELIRSVFKHSGWVSRIGRHERVYEYGITPDGRLACSDLAKRLAAHGVQQPQAEFGEPEPTCGTRPITYAGRTIRVPRVRSVFDLGAEVSNEIQRAAE